MRQKKVDDVGPAGWIITQLNLRLQEAASTNRRTLRSKTSAISTTPTTIINMKAFVIVFVICIASSFAATITDTQRAKLQEFKATCIAETGVSPDAVENAKKGTIDEGDAKLACFAACFLKKAGFVNAEGAFDEAGFRAQIPADVPKEKVDAIVNKCSSQTGANACETGGKLLKCYLENKTTSLLQ